MKPRSTRLNVNNRDNFIKAVVDATLPEAKKPRDDDFINRWRDKVYDIAYGEYLERMKTLPSWFFCESRDLRVQIYYNQGTNKTTLCFHLDKPVLALNPHSGYGSDKITTSITIPKDHKMTQDFIQHRQNQQDYATKQQKLRSQLRDLAYSCNTSGQLYEAWPEAIKYADCFPYTAPERHPGATVSATEMRVSMAMSKANIKLPEMD